MKQDTAGRSWRPSPSSSCTEKDGIGRANPLGSLETKNTNSLAARLPRGETPAQVLPTNASTPHPSGLRAKLSATSGWKRSQGSSKAMVTTATQGRDLEGKGTQRARRRKDTASGREARHGCYSRDEPLFKGRLPCSRLEAQREASPDTHRGIHPMTRGPGPTSHTAGALAFECEEGACYRPAVVRPLHLRRD
jgi:hypothetical protein